MKMIKILFFLLVTAVIMPAQDKESSEDVKLLLQQEINNARQNMEVFRKQKESVKQKENFYEAGTNTGETEFPVVKLTLLFSVGITSFSYVYYKRQKKEISRKKKQALKDRVLMLRDEKIFPGNTLRNNTNIRLKETTVVNNVKQNKLTHIARELNISKGEVIFAARLRAHAKQAGKHNRREEFRGNFADKVTLSWK